jgi:GTP-binding protein
MAALLKAYLSGRATLRRAFVLIDARHGPKPVDEEIMTCSTPPPSPFRRC